MNRKLLQYYNEELAYIRHGCHEFKKQYPRAAQNLHLNNEVTEDPHVTRLIESFSLISSRIRCQLDEQGSNISKSLLSILYPHYLAPIPSMTVIQITPQSSLIKPHLIAKHTQVETDAVVGGNCVFKTCYDTTLVPLTVTQVIWSQDKATTLEKSSEASSCLSVTLSTLNAKLNIQTLGLNKLRFYIQEKNEVSLKLYYNLFKNTHSVSIHLPGRNQVLASLSPDCICPVGFAKDETLFPWKKNSSPIHQLLTEFFSFPEKFLFFDLILEDDLWAICDEPQLQINWYFNHSTDKQEYFLDQNSFSLNCVPVINLFHKIIEPVMVDNQSNEYPLIVDKHALDHNEVYHVEKVVDVSNPQKPQALPELFSIDYSKAKQSWYMHRPSNTSRSNQNSATMLSISQPMDKPLAQQILHIEATCFNADLPHKLFFPSNKSHMHWVSSSMPTSCIRCLHQPTPVYNYYLQQEHIWQLVANLAGRQRLLEDYQKGVSHVRQHLRSYNLTDIGYNNDLIQSICEVKVTSQMMRINNNYLSPFVLGQRIEIEFSENEPLKYYQYLLAQVIRLCLTQDQPINSKVEIVFSYNNQETNW